MAKLRSYRLTEENEIRLKNLMEYWKLDNPNQTLNYLIFHSWEVMKWKPALDHFRELVQLINQDKPNRRDAPA